VGASGRQRPRADDRRRHRPRPRGRRRTGECPGSRRHVPDRRTPHHRLRGARFVTRILIAEDEERIVSFLHKGLRAAGYTTLSVDDGLDALALARDESFDLLVLDLGLPGIGGHEVLRRMRARGERMPVIILTARAGVDDTVAGLEGGADDYVTKPFRFEELLARIRVRLRDSEAAESTVLRAGDVTLD